jgi:hypothetical protein
MRIAMVGGIERGLDLFERVAARGGHTIEIHGGHMRGTGVANLEALISRADFVIVLTDVNSHGAVQHARRFLRRANVRHILLRRCGVSRFSELLDELTRVPQESVQRRAG